MKINDNNKPFVRTEVNIEPLIKTKIGNVIITLTSNKFFLLDKNSIMRRIINSTIAEIKTPNKPIFAYPSEIIPVFAFALLKKILPISRGKSV